MPSRRTHVPTPATLAGPFVDLTLHRLRSWGGGRPGAVLDPGCGSGLFLDLLGRRLPEARWRLVGVESDPSLARAARETASRIANARVFLGDFFDASWSEVRPAEKGRNGCDAPGERSGRGAREAGAAGAGRYEPLAGSFRAVVGNPPFLGFKAQGARLRDRLAGRFGPGFGKADLSCYAVARSLELLEPGGLLALILPRYWMVGSSGAGARRLLERDCDRIEIRTWPAARAFGAAGVHVLCLWARKRSGAGSGGRLRYVVLPEGRLDGPAIGRRDKGWPASGPLWPPLLKVEEEFLDAMRALGAPLGAWASSAQGVITGADRTRDRRSGIFVLSSEELRSLNLSGPELRFIHPWIKARHVEACRTRPSGLHVLHLPREAVPARLPRLRRHLERHRDRLEARREVKQGCIPWWCHQWERPADLFRGPRVLLPAKARVVRAAVAPGGVRFSADIYSWRLLPDPPSRGPMAPAAAARWLALYLCSAPGRIASRLLGKKMGATVELYPQTQRHVPVPDPQIVGPQLVGPDVVGTGGPPRASVSPARLETSLLEIGRAIFRKAGFDEGRVQDLVRSSSVSM